MDYSGIATRNALPGGGSDNGPDDPLYPYSDRPAPVKQRPPGGSTAAAVEEPDEE
jgi:hypothetical protein